MDYNAILIKKDGSILDKIVLSGNPLEYIYYPVYNKIDSHMFAFHNLTPNNIINHSGFHDNIIKCQPQHKLKFRLLRTLNPAGKMIYYEE